MSTRHNRLRRKGFNLVEAAIVLGVVGLIIGGIWIAAAMVQENIRAQQLRSGTLGLIGQFRNAFELSSFPVSNGTCQSRDVTTVARLLQLVPRDWPSDASGLMAPTGGYLMVSLKTDCIPPYSQTYELEVYIYGTSTARINAFMRALIPLAANNSQVSLSCTSWGYAAATIIPACTGYEGRLLVRY